MTDYENETDEDVFDGLSEETQTRIIELVEDAATRMLVENIADIVGAVHEEICQKVDEYLGDYALPELEQRIAEAKDDVAFMIVKAVNLLTPEARERWLKDVVADARKRASDQGEYRGTDGVPDDEGTENRNSLRPNSGRSYGVQDVREGVVSDNLELRDAMLLKAKAQKQQYHERLLEYLAHKEAGLQAGKILRG